jgi:hypothetical protein
MSTALVPYNAPLEVSAETPEEMTLAQNSLIAWCKNKIAELQAQTAELTEALNHAKKQKWKTATLLKHANLSARRVIYYDKMLAALEHGFIIVPNFPVTIFAIRTTKKGPKNDEEVSTYQTGTRFFQASEQLPEGEGDYKNPFPIVHQSVSTENNPHTGQPIQKYRSWPEEWDEFEFPLNMAKPKVMEATTRAMALKLFDDFGILPGPKSKADPIIVGRLIDPRNPSRFSPSCVSFMVAWHLDTRTL